MIAPRHLPDRAGLEWHVRKSFFTFLSKAQNEFTDQLLWIDALCIGQSYIQERNRQVQMKCWYDSKMLSGLLVSSFTSLNLASGKGSKTGQISRPVASAH